MLTPVIWVTVAAVVLAALRYLAVAGLRNGHRPGDALVTAVPAGGAAECAVPARARRTVLTVAVGQAGGRLRMHRLRLGPAGFPAGARATIMVA